MANERFTLNEKVLNAMQEKLIGRFKTFCECYPTKLYIGLTGVETLQDK